MSIYWIIAEYGYAVLSVSVGGMKIVTRSSAVDEFLNRLNGLDVKIVNMKEIGVIEGRQAKRDCLTEFVLEVPSGVNLVSEVGRL